MRETRGNARALCHVAGMIFAAVMLPALAASSSDVPFELRCSTDSEQYRLGEPVFVQLQLENVDSVPYVVFLTGGGTHKEEVVFELARANKQYERVSISHHWTGNYSSCLLDRCKSYPIYKVLWFRAYDGPDARGKTPPWPEPRPLVFREPGLYRYRFTVKGGYVNEGASPSENQPMTLVATGQVRITEPAEGLDRLTDVLGRLVWTRYTIPLVGRKDAERIDELIEGTSKTPYAIHVKWVRLGIFVRQGLEWCNERLEAGDTDAVEQHLKRMESLADEVLTKLGGFSTIAMEYALFTKGFVAWYQHEEDAAQQALARMKKHFTDSWHMERLQLIVRWGADEMSFTALQQKWDKGKPQ